MSKHCAGCSGWVSTYSGQGEGYECDGLDAAREGQGLDEEGSLALSALQHAIRHAGMLRTESVTIQAPLARYLATRLAEAQQREGAGE